MANNNGNGNNGQRPQLQKPLTAVQRIDNLERALTNAYQNLQMIISDVGTTKEAIKLLGNKLDAIVRAISTGQDVNDDIINKLMIENNVNELKAKVDQLLAQKVLAATDTVAENTFVVGRELASDKDDVINPRLQFAISALQKEVADKIMGKKAGDIVTVEEGKLRFQVLEVYGIQAPEVEEEDLGEGEADQDNTAEAAPTTDAAPAAQQTAPTPTLVPAPAATEETQSSENTAPASTTGAAQ